MNHPVRTGGSMEAARSMGEITESRRFEVGVAVQMLTVIDTRIRQDAPTQKPTAETVPAAQHTSVSSPEAQALYTQHNAQQLVREAEALVDRAYQRVAKEAAVVGEPVAHMRQAYSDAYAVDPHTPKDNDESMTPGERTRSEAVQQDPQVANTVRQGDVWDFPVPPAVHNTTQQQYGQAA